ncbi:hypothetical protein Tco_0006081 [Tanacetum coccineum]
MDKADLRTAKIGRPVESLKECVFRNGAEYKTGSKIPSVDKWYKCAFLEILESVRMYKIRTPTSSGAAGDGKRLLGEGNEGIEVGLDGCGKVKRG